MKTLIVVIIISYDRLRKIWRNIDKNCDGKVSFDEFVQGLREEPILIKALLQEGPSVDAEEKEI